MATRRSIGLAVAFAAAFAVVGIPYWRIPYQQVGLPGDLWGWGLVVVAAVAFAAQAILSTRFWSTALVVGAAVPAAVLARVVVEAAADPTTHNLWPLELVLSAVPGFVASGLGALAGWAMVRGLLAKAGEGG